MGDYEIQKFAMYAPAPAETCFANTSFKGTINGRIPSGNHDIQVFADRVILTNGEIASPDHDVMSVCKLQYYCLRECWIQNAGPGKDYLAHLKDFPAFTGNFQAELTRVKELCEENQQKKIFPLKIICPIEPSDTLIYNTEFVLVLVPNNIGFINGVINFVLGNFTPHMKLIYTACRSIRQGRQPTAAVLKTIRK